MSVNLEFDNLQKKIAELEKELASLIQKEQAMKEGMVELGGKVAAKLEEKVKAKKADLEKLEFTQKDLEKKLEELQPREPSVSPNESPPKLVEKEEESPKQVIEVAIGGSQQPQFEERKEIRKEEKKRKWM